MSEKIEIKSLNGHPLADTTAREKIAALEAGGGSGGVAQEIDPTVPAWAKQPEKPTYTAEEVGAASAESVAKLSEEIAKVKGDGTPHQQLVTDGSGVAKWEDRTHYEDSCVRVLFDGEPVFSKFGRGSAQFIVGEAGENRVMLNPNAVYTVVLNGVEYMDLPLVKWTFGFILGDLSMGAALPFYISSYNSDDNTSAMELYTPESYGDTCSFKLIETVKTIKTIDPKYLPGGGGSGSIFYDGNTYTTDLIYADVVNAVHSGRMPEVTYFLKNMGYTISARKVTAIDAITGPDGAVLAVNLIVNQGEVTFVLNPDGTIVKQ